MIYRLRLAWTAVLLGLLTLPLAAYQLIAFRTGWFDITRAPQLWYRVAAWAFRFRIVVHGSPTERRPLLVVSNHISWTDIIVLGSLIRGSFVAKAEVAKWPVVGALSSIQGTVLVAREQKRSAGRQVDMLARCLAAGRPAILFAEGTTADGSRMLPFKSALFGAARNVLDGSATTSVAVQPVSIAYTHMGGLVMGRGLRGQVAWLGDEPLGPHLRRLLTLNPLTVEVRFGEPVEVSLGADRKEVARAAEARTRAMFARSLAGPAVEAERQSL